MVDENDASGRLIGGQFRVIRDLGEVLGYRRFECLDEGTDVTVLLRLIGKDELEKYGAGIRIQKDVKKAGQLIHKNIGRVLGFGKDEKDLFVVEEHVPGFLLSHLLGRRRDTDRPFELKQAFYLTIHLCNALSRSADILPHGLLAPSHVIMRKDGRPKVVGFGLKSALPGVLESDGIEDWDKACLAEHLVEARDKDLFALGRIFYALLKNDVNLSSSFAEQVEQDDTLSSGLMRLLLRCAGEGDVKSLSGPLEFREELHNVVSDIMQTPQNKAKSPSAGPPPMPSELDLDVIAKPAGVELLKRDESAVLDEAMDELRWMYRLNDREYGPVSGAQLVSKLDAGELTAYAPVKDIQKGGFNPMSEVSFFSRVTSTWVNETAEREAKLKKERDRERSVKVKRRVTMFSLLLVTFGAFGYGAFAIKRTLEPVPLVIDFDGLLTINVPEINVPEPPERDPAFKEKWDQYNQILAKRPKVTTRKGGGTGDGSATSFIDFSKSASSQAQVEEEMTRRLYANLSRNSGLLSCFRDALSTGQSRQTFNLQVTVLPNGALTEIRLPNVSMEVAGCVKRTLSTHRVRSIKGVTVTATLPFTVQR